ncbi:MAG: hypothetical protein IT393_11870 [Nitrospirae bacterium]|nr:hypothetical protein [Nitrospirota bacterium]
MPEIESERFRERLLIVDDDESVRDISKHFSHIMVMKSWRKVWVESDHGCGTTVSMEIPYGLPQATGVATKGC